MVRHDDGRNPACNNGTLETSMPTKIEKTPLFLIGQNRRGNWVATMKHGLTGGLFINRAAALKFALFENGNHPEAVVAVPGVLELDLGTNAMGADALAA
jgi:hypothetical protein